MRQTSTDYPETSDPTEAISVEEESSTAKPDASTYAVSPFYAFLLALLHPGIGMTYATSQWRIGLALVVVYHLGKLVGLLLYIRTGWFPVFVGLYGLLMLVSLGFAFFAVREAKQIKLRTSTFIKVLGVVGLSVFLSYSISTRWVTHLYRVSSHSMAPTIQSGDYLMVNKMAYGLWNPWTSRLVAWGPGPQRGDVVVFQYPKDPRKAYIKRVVGLPGDTVELKQGLLYINGKPTPRMYKEHYSYKAWDPDKKKMVTRNTLAFQETLSNKTYTTLRDQQGLPLWRNWSSKKHALQSDPPWGPVIPSGHVFVLGDNRDRSSDSRDWGLVSQSKIVGKVLHILLSRNKTIRWKRIGKSIN